MYKGREGQWAFTLHRLSGLAILAYLLLHVFSIGSFIFGEAFYMRIHHVYDFWLFRVGLIGVVAAAVYHAFNGLRIVLMDFTGFGVKIHRPVWYLVLLLSLAAAGYCAWVMYPRITGGY